MIGRSLPEYIFIRASIGGLLLIAPLSVIYLLASFQSGAFLLSPILGAYAVAEAAFWLLVYLPRIAHMQKAAQYPPLMSREERIALFDKCQKHMTQSSTIGWFQSDTGSWKIRRGNAVRWLLWSFFFKHEGDMLEEWEEELNYYLSVLSSFLGYQLEHGYNADMTSMRTTIDPVIAAHRPMIWYWIVGLVDSLTSVTMFYHGFKHYNIHEWFKLFPPRPLLAIFSKSSPDPDVPYWYRPHRSLTKHPILFIHGIGIGLWPYTPFLTELIAQDPDVGIIAIENLVISMRMTSAPLSREQTVTAITRILDAHDIRRVVVAGHSYGTVVTAHLLHSPLLAPRIAGMLLVDPIPFLLNHPSVAYNFVYREPREANEWQLWYFASRDADVARSLARHFFWFESILFKEELEGRNVAVSLAASDQIVDAPAVRRYLTGQEEPHEYWKEGRLEVLYFPELDHATIFDSKSRRTALVDILGRLCISNASY